MSKQQYKVIALSVGGLKNKVFESGDTVTADQFNVPVQTLVDAGFLKPIGETQRAAPKVEKVAEPVEQPKAEPVKEEAIVEETPSFPAYKDITRTGILELLDDKPAMEGKYQSNWGKKKLYKILVE